MPEKEAAFGEVLLEAVDIGKYTYIHTGV